MAWIPGIFKFSEAAVKKKVLDESIIFFSDFLFLNLSNWFKLAQRESNPRSSSREKSRGVRATGKLIQSWHNFLRPRENQCPMVHSYIKKITLGEVQVVPVVVVTGARGGAGGLPACPEDHGHARVNDDFFLLFVTIFLLFLPGRRGETRPRRCASFTRPHVRWLHSSHFNCNQDTLLITRDCRFFDRNKNRRCARDGGRRSSDAILFVPTLFSPHQKHSISRVVCVWVPFFFFFLW